MQRLMREALRAAREAGFDAEIIPHKKHPKLKVTRNGRTFRLTFAGSPTDGDITIRKIQRDLRLYCNG